MIFSRSLDSLKVLLVLATFIVSSLMLVSGEIRGNDWRDLLLTKSEKQKLDVFKERVIKRLPESYMKTDFYLIRWLRARNYNLQSAQDMLFENLKWREQNKMSNILTEDFSDVSEEFPVTLDGHDKQGRPIATLDMGEWDLRSAVLQGKLPRVLRYMDWFQEKILHQILEAQKAGKPVTRAVVLVDVEGFNLMQHLCSSCMSVFIRMTVSMESHFPGFWEFIAVVNAPASSRIGLEAVRPVMSPQTRDILKIFDTNKRQWMQYLDERIDKDQLYPNFGGTKKPKDY